MKGNFDSNSGKGTQRYAHELAQNLMEMSAKRGVRVDKLELGFGSSSLTHKVSFTLSIPFRPILKYDIIHLTAPIMFALPLKGSSTLVTTATEYQRIPPTSLGVELILQ